MSGSESRRLSQNNPQFPHIIEGLQYKQAVSLPSIALRLHNHQSSSTLTHPNCSHRNLDYLTKLKLLSHHKRSHPETLALPH